MNLFVSFIWKRIGQLTSKQNRCYTEKKKDGDGLTYLLRAVLLFSDNNNYDPYSDEDDSEKAWEGKERLEKRTETKQTNKNEKERQEATV